MQNVFFKFLAGKLFVFLRKSELIAKLQGIQLARNLHSVFLFKFIRGKGICLMLYIFVKFYFFDAIRDKEKLVTANGSFVS